MIRLQNRSKSFRLLDDLGLLGRNGLLKAGIVSLLLHALLIALFVFCLNATHTKGGPSIYRVTLRTLSPQEQLSPSPTNESSPAKPQDQKEKNKREIKHWKPLIERKNLESEICSSTLTVTHQNPLEEQKQILQRREEETPPIPLPIGEQSLSEKDSHIKMEDDPPIPLTLSRPEEQSQDIGHGRGHGEGLGQGGPGSGESGDGLGKGRGGSGSGEGGFGWEGPLKGAGIGQGGPGGGGFGKGTGRGGSGGGGSGGYGVGVFRPKHADNPKPDYPQEARAKGYQGVVLLKVEVLSNGCVGQLEVKKSSGYEELDRSALAAVQKWKFIPARKGGVVIPCWVNVPIKFELQ